jgi:hypothetical protein
VVAASYPTTFAYTKENGEWSLDQELPGGGLVDMEGDTLAASRFDHSTGSNDIVLYERTEAGLEQTALIDQGKPTLVACDLDLDETQTTLVIGSCIDHRVYGVQTETTVPNPGGSQTTVHAGAVGSALVYKLADGGWNQTADLPNPDPTPDSDLFGRSVGVSGSNIVVGAPWENDNGGKDGSGATYVYSKQAGSWLLDAKLRNHDNGPYAGGDAFGFSVDIEAETIVAGAPFDDHRQDGTPYPANDDGDVPPCVQAFGNSVVDGCDDGENVGSVYLFGPPSAGNGQVLG